MKKTCLLIFLISVIGFQVWAGGVSEDSVTPAPSMEMTEITDALGRQLQVPQNPEYIICSGPGALRLATYLQAEDLVVAVDDMESERPSFDARPYALANPGFTKLPIFGEFRGHDNPELILTLEPQPQVIFKTYPTSGYDPAELQKKTGIPVVTLNYGDLVGNREALNHSLRIMAKILNKTERAESLITYIDEMIIDLQTRAALVPEDQRISCYVGGIAYSGPHGIQSTEPAYPPFLFTNALNVAFEPNKPIKEQRHADMAKEQIIEWDPEVIFIDVSTMQSGDLSGALYELTHQKIFDNMRAVQGGNIYGVLPYNWYTQNFGSILADAYYVGKVLYPEAFGDIDPVKKADDIYTAFVGRPVFEKLNESFGNLIFSKLEQ
ncbi:MAG: iron ABC transporter substrate-binding protein [Spirochaetales bacterium]|nr:iron ABC transporter substrate-binding protein [Spirochaetales bacterium]